MAKKKDFQTDFKKFMEQAKEKFGEISREVGILAKKGEKEVVKVSKRGRLQFDIMGISMQKEKIYYDIGKKIVSLNAKKKLEMPEIELYLKKIRGLESSARKKKREMGRVS